MVAVVRPQMLDAVRRVCAHWELPCTPIGDVTDTEAADPVGDDRPAGGLDDLGPPRLGAHPLAHGSPA